MGDLVSGAGDLELRSNFRPLETLRIIRGLRALRTFVRLPPAPLREDRCRWSVVDVSVRPAILGRRESVVDRRTSRAALAAPDTPRDGTTVTFSAARLAGA